MAKTAKRKTGDVGEGVACKYLEGRGYTVLERNYLRPWGEIDVIAKLGGVLHFVEVKSVTVKVCLPAGRQVSCESLPFVSGAGEAGGSRETRYRPEENVHPAKLKRLHRAIQTYLLDHKVPEDTPWQLDVACVYLDFATRRARVEMLENVI